MRILALEFSTALRSVALVEEGRVICREQEGTAGRGPAWLIRAVLKQAGLRPEDIGCLAVGLGPGSYTGIRVAIAVAQGWELAREVRLLGVSSVECLAWRAWLEGRHGEVAVVVDAQRGDYYAARFRLHHEGVDHATKLAIVSPAEIQRWVDEGVAVVGPDLRDPPWNVRALYPEAGMLGVLAWERDDYVGGSELEPIYLRATQFVKAPPPRKIPSI